MNRTVRLHLKSICPTNVDLDSPVFRGGGTRPSSRFRELCKLAGVSTKRDIESGEEQEWVLKDLRKTCATYYDEHIPESSIEILGHSAGGITYRHYAHRAPLAFRAILSLPQPSAFKSLAQGFEGPVPLLQTAILTTCRLRSFDHVTKDGHGRFVLSAQFGASLRPPPERWKASVHELSKLEKLPCVSEMGVVSRASFFKIILNRSSTRLSLQFYSGPAS